MTKYLHKFDTQAEFESAYTSDAYIEPWTSYVVENGAVSYNKIIPSEAGDIVYYNNGTLKFCKSANWDSGLGTPVAIVVVPSGHTPDGTVRCAAVTGVKTDGTSANTHAKAVWGPDSNIDLPVLNRVITWDNTIGGSLFSSIGGYLSSNKVMNGAVDCLDSNLKYSVSSGGYTPNPYLPNGSPNPDYRNTVEGTTANCLSDFDGAGNTAVIVNLGASYSAANACYLYSTPGIEAGKWYLPAAGELGYVMPRLMQIQSALTAVGGVPFQTSSSDYWTSTVMSSNHARTIRISEGYVTYASRSYSMVPRPFCSLPGNLGF